MAKVAKPKTKAVKVAAPKATEFVITVKIDNAMYQGTGITALEALRAVPAPSSDLISSGSVRIEHGGKNKEMFFPTMQLRRLLNPHNMEVLINDLQEGM